MSLLPTSASTLGAFRGADRRLLRRVQSAFEKAGRFLVPSGTVFAEAGETLRRLQAERGYALASSPSLVADVLIALSARAIGAVVVTQNERDFRAIRAIRPFHLEIVRAALGRRPC